MWRGVAIVTVAASTAYAEPPQAGENPFVTLGRIDGRTRGRIELAYGTHKEFGDFSTFEAKTFALDMHAQWVDQTRGIGAYIAAGAGKLYFEGEGRPIEPAGLELGGLTAHRLDEHVDLVTHLGIVHNFRDRASLGFARVADAIRSSSRPTWTRLTVSPVFRSGIAVARVDVGLDVPVGDDEQFAPGPVLRLGAGVGIHRGIVRAGLEVAMASDIRQASYFDHPVRGALGTVAATYRFALDKIEIYVAAVVPIKTPEAGTSLILGVDLIHPRRH